jgi:hypothetical protein
MRDFGIVSNRVFDVVASGGRLVSDHLPAIHMLLGDAVETVRGPAELSAALREPRGGGSASEREAAAADVVRNHSFDARAGALLEVVRSQLRGRSPDLPDHALPLPGRSRRARVGLLPTKHRAVVTSSAYIRLIAPLTTEDAHRRVEPILLSGPDDPRLGECDICIVQRVSVPEPEEAARMIEGLRRRGVRLFVDTDDAFGAHEAHAHKDAALRHFMQEAEAVWFSTRTLADHYPEVGARGGVVPNQLDPRLWRDYRAPASTAFADGPLRLLYMGTLTHHGDFPVLRPALDALARDRPGSFELTLIGAVRDPDPAPWLRRRPPPSGGGVYPRFVRWLREQRGFDVGVAPLADTPFNAAKSDIKALDYSAMGLLTLASEGDAYAGRVGEGLAVGVDAGGWRAAIESVLDDRHAHEAMRRAALEDVWARRSTLAHPHPLLSL